MPKGKNTCQKTDAVLQCKSAVLQPAEEKLETKGMIKLKKMKTRTVVMSAVIGAIYVVLTVVLAPISYGAVQFRVSEALCVLPFLYPPCIPGLVIGCVISNLIGSTVIDAVFGSIATLLAALWTAKLKNKWLTPIPMTVLNGVIVGIVITQMMAPENFLVTFIPIAASVAAGEIAVGYVLGIPLLALFSKIQDKFNIR